MIHIYCNRGSDGAGALVKKINEIRPESANRLREVRTLPATDLVVNWGTRHMDLVGPPASFGRARVLNRRIPRNKYAELVALSDHAVATVPFSRTRRDGWLARTFNHQEARDLLANLPTGDYYVQYVENIREFRVHIWNGVSARAGIKIPRIANPNNRFRSWSGGWKLDYGAACQEAIRQSVRTMAAQAVSALGLDFGAVDVGIKPNGTPFVFEVNTAPGLEGRTVDTYAEKILALR